MDKIMFKMVEPRIAAIKNEVERLLSLVQFERQGHPIGIDGFRLRDLANWKIDYARNAFDALGSLSGSCNAKCVFCYEECIPFTRDRSILSVEETDTRLRYFSPETHKCLFPSARPYMETFLNKEAINIFKKARSINPQALLIITTNGSCLTDGIIDQLSSIKPVLIKLSVNSTNPEVRQSLTGLKNKSHDPRMVMSLIRKAKIPFIGSVVAWPERELNELEQTIKDISNYEPYGIRVRLPLVHKYTPSIPKGDMDGFWHDIYDFVLSIRGQFETPVWVEPLQFRRAQVMPIIDGIILNSPAMLAGIRPGDEIVAINEKVLCSRSEIRQFFSSGALDSMKHVNVKIKRKGKSLNFHLKSSNLETTYPYDPYLHHPGERLGMLSLPDFSLSYINNILRLTLKHGAKKVLLFCSPLTAGTVESLIEQIPSYNNFFKEITLWIYVLEKTWMEGNTYLMESRFVDDYESAFLKICGEVRNRPDLILIPDVFGSSWGIDFNARSIFEFQHRSGIPIELIPWHYIYGRED